MLIRRLMNRALMPILLMGLLLAPRAARAQEPVPADTRPDDARGVAVALNYCRASFHRIRKYPSKRVLLEERELILNNLNLNGIADEEVVRLYTAVLAEISDVQIAERDRQLIREQFQRQLEKQLFFASWALSTQLAMGDYVNAVRTGANSWWDYRALTWQKDLDAWKVEKSQLVGVVDKSSLFLDTFWKMTRKRGIPDRWLVRGDDLEQLEAAVREPDPVTRLRVLRRMEPFMECYPPYWYYVARTQQMLGQLFASAATYEKMAALGESHFRRDEMLAAGLANRAMIQDYLNQPSAPHTARGALGHSTAVWEVNLVCSAILERHGSLAEAEDAILRNLDVGLEQEQSRVALIAFYTRTGNRARLSERLRAGALPALPPILLADAALMLGSDPASSAVFQRLTDSLVVYPELRIGKDDLVVLAAPGWNLAQAEITLTANGERFDAPKLGLGRGGVVEARYRGVAELGNSLKPALPATLRLSVAWPGGRTAEFQLQPPRAGEKDTAEVDAERSLLAGLFPLPARQPTWRIVGVSPADASVSQR